MSFVRLLTDYVGVFNPVISISSSLNRRYGVSCPVMNGQLFIGMPPLSEGVHSMYHQVALNILGAEHPTVQYLKKMGKPVGSCAYFMPDSFPTVLLHSMALAHTQDHHPKTQPGLRFPPPYVRKGLSVQGIMWRFNGLTKNFLAARLRGISLIALGGDGKMEDDHLDYIVFGTLPYTMEVNGKKVEGSVFEVLEYPQHIKDWRWFVHIIPEVYFLFVWLSFYEERVSFLGMSADCSRKKLFEPKEDNPLDQMILEMYAEYFTPQELDEWVEQVTQYFA